MASSNQLTDVVLLEIGTHFNSEVVQSQWFHVSNKEVLNRVSYIIIYMKFL